ncbi:MAG: HlyC/CorC family transporter [Solirubrobacteraceae bacterium]|nr:HlyC/CorC family transporter [Solirubrobacteraceae bacterium]
MSTFWAIVLSLVLLAANAFFVGAEFALVSARRSVIEPRADEGNRVARLTLRAMERVSLMMAGAQLGITICSLGLGYLGEPAIAHLLEGPFEAVGLPGALVHPVAFAIALALVSFLHVVLGEMVPKNLALAGPERSALVLAPILAAVVRVLRPAIASLNWIANVTLRAVGITPRDEVTSAFTRDEVAALVEESRREGLLDQHEGRLLVGALTFEERDARSVLLPLDGLVTVEHDVTPAELEQVAARTGYSRFPVRRDGLMIGYLHLKDVLEFEDRHRNRPIAPSWIRPMPTVSVDDRLRAILARMQRTGAHLARVEAADGELLGVVALEDVLEELVGEIRDEATAGARRAVRGRR